MSVGDIYQVHLFNFILSVHACRKVVRTTELRVDQVRRDK